MKEKKKWFGIDIAQILFNSIKRLGDFMCCARDMRMNVVRKVCECNAPIYDHYHIKYKTLHTFFSKYKNAHEAQNSKCIRLILSAVVMNTYIAQRDLITKLKFNA